MVLALVPACAAASSSSAGEGGAPKTERSADAGDATVTDGHADASDASVMDPTSTEEAGAQCIEPTDAGEAVSVFDAAFTDAGPVPTLIALRPAS